jgi:hypothetical protein
MNATIKISNSESLFVSPSLVTGLYTNTAVKNNNSGGSSTSTATAMGGVYMRAVLIDALGNTIIGEPVASCGASVFGCQNVGGAYGVTLDSRVQTLTQTLSACTVSTGGTCSFSLTTQLILQTTSAHSFNFIFPNVGVGTYKVQIQAAVNSNASASSTATAVGAAAFGLGSLTVESVRLVNDFTFAF